MSGRTDGGMAGSVSGTENDTGDRAGLPLVAVGALGGTIAMTSQDEGSSGSAVTPELSADDLIATAPAVRTLAQVVTRSIRNVGSASVRFADVLAALDWANDQIRAGATGVVLTHGTDTMEETVYLLDLLWEHDEPLVVTGAMRSPDAPGADGPANLLAAVRAAIDPQLRGLGALLVMHDEIHLAATVTKGHTTAVAPFVSPDSGALAVLHEDRVVLDHLPAAPRPRPLPRPTDPAAEQTRVALIEAVLGDGGDLVDLAVGSGRYAGIVLAGAGSGHVSEAAAPMVSAAVDAGLSVVVASRIGRGRTTTGSYGYPGSEADLQRRGALMAGALSARKARLLLWVLLATGAERSDVAAEFASRG